MSVLIAPSANEWADSRAEYEDLLRKLRAEGFDAGLQEPRDGNYSTGGIVTDPLIDLSIFLWEQVSEATIGAIVALAINSLARKRSVSEGERREGVIYGPEGGVLRTFELPSDDSP